MAWMYLVVCITDFIIFPILWSILQARYSGSVVAGWEPLTLKGAGMFHMALGAILGVAAWTRGQEKIERLNYRYPNYEGSSGRYSSRRVPTQRDEEL